MQWADPLPIGIELKMDKKRYQLMLEEKDQDR